MALTKNNILRELEKEGSLTTLLPIEEFAEPERLADELADEFLTTLKPTQLRKVFHAIKAIERRFKREEESRKLKSEERADIRLLVPELAYARARDLIP